MATIEGYKYRVKGTTITHAQLTAAGVTDVIKMLSCKAFVYQYKVASINTNVVVRIEGSNDNTNFYNLDADEVDTTITANGTYAFRFDGEVPYSRFRLVSETGGTDATIDVVVFLE